MPERSFRNSQSKGAQVKIGIVVGHNSVAQGAVRCTDRRSEFDWNGELARLIELHDSASVGVFFRTPGGGYSAEIDRVYGETDAWGADVTVELHFNSVAASTAEGCVMLSSGTSGSLLLAREMQKRCLAVMQNRDRGVRVLGRHDRGGRSLWQGRAPAVLIEPYFGSNAEDCTRSHNRMDQLAEAIFRAAKTAATEIRN